MNAARPSTLSPIAILALIAPASAQQAPKLTERTFERLRDYVLPSREEDRWRDVGWRGTYWDAVIEANEQEKPILLWAMNGHPLGHT